MIYLFAHTHPYFRSPVVLYPHTSLFPRAVITCSSTLVEILSLETLQGFLYNGEETKELGISYSE